MANSIDVRLTSLEERLDKAEKKIRQQHGTIVALQTAAKAGTKEEDN